MQDYRQEEAMMLPTAVGALVLLYTSQQAPYDPSPSLVHHVTETTLVREMLHLACALPSKLFTCNEALGSFELVPDITPHLMHLSPDVVHHVLDDWTRSASVLLRLERYVVRTLQPTNSAGLTSQAFASAMYDYITEYRREVLAVERSMHSWRRRSFFPSSSSDEPKRSPESEDSDGVGVTLVALHKLLTAHTHRLLLIARTYAVASGLSDITDLTQPWPMALNDSVVPSPADRAVRLLTSWYECVQEAWGIGDNSLYNVVVRIWLGGLRPYLAMLEDWLYNGAFGDPFSEFMIQCTSEIQPNSLEYWTSAFRLRCVQSGEEAVPSFLSSVAALVLLAGKALNLLQNVQEHKHLFTDENRTSLFDQLYTAMMHTRPEHAANRMLSLKSISGGIDEQATTIDAVLSPPLMQLSLTSSRDSTTMISDENIGGAPTPSPAPAPARHACSLRPRTKRPTTSTTYEGQEQADRKGSSRSSTVTVDMVATCVVVEETLLSNVRRRCREVNSGLISLLMEDMQLVEHLATLRAFHFSAAGDVIHQFAVALFEKFERKERWQDLHVVNSLFYEALRPEMDLGTTDLHSVLTFKLATPSSSNPSSSTTTSLDAPPPSAPPTASSSATAKVSVPEFSLAALEALSLSYTVRWPLDIVISSSAMEIYNKVLVFLLQIRRAKYCLDRLRGRQQLKRGGPHMHRFMLLHHELLSFVNSLYNFVVAGVGVSLWNELQAKLQAAQDVDELCAIHMTYLLTIRDRCLLNPKAEVVLDSVKKQLALVVRFREEYELYSSLEKSSAETPLARNALANLGRIGTDFRKINRFLLLVLDRIVRHGSHPHLVNLKLQLNFNNFYS